VTPPLCVIATPLIHCCQHPRACVCGREITILAAAAAALEGGGKVEAHTADPAGQAKISRMSSAQALVIRAGSQGAAVDLPTTPTTTPLAARAAAASAGTAMEMTGCPTQGAVAEVPSAPSMQWANRAALGL
jgi:hypothetical protein